MEIANFLSDFNMNTKCCNYKKKRLICSLAPAFGLRWKFLEYLHLCVIVHASSESGLINLIKSIVFGVIDSKSFHSRRRQPLLALFARIRCRIAISVVITAQTGRV